MSMMPRNTSDTSVAVSLAELARIEAERVREEEARRARDREIDARARRTAEADRRAAETQQAMAREEARIRREREEAAERVRAEARERAAADVARIEAEARVRLAEENERRAHEIVLLRARTEGGRRRLVVGLAAALVVALSGGGVTAYRASQQVASLEREVADLRDGQQALAREREHAKTTELSALDRRFAALRAGSLAGAEDARLTAEAARRAVDEKALDHDRLRAYADALDGLQARADGQERIAALDRRYGDLTAWAGSLRRGDATATAQRAAAQARATGADEALRAYGGALDHLRETLAQAPSSAPGRVVVDRTGHADRGCAGPGDPGCGLDGRRVF